MSNEFSFIGSINWTHPKRWSWVLFISDAHVVPGLDAKRLQTSPPIKCVYRSDFWPKTNQQKNWVFVTVSMENLNWYSHWTWPQQTVSARRSKPFTPAHAWDRYLSCPGLSIFALNTTKLSNSVKLNGKLRVSEKHTYIQKTRVWGVVLLSAKEIDLRMRSKEWEIAQIDCMARLYFKFVYSDKISLAAV